MRYFQIATGCELRLGVQTGDDVVTDLTGVKGRVRSVLDLMHAASVLGTDMDVAAEDLVGSGTGVRYSLGELEENSRDGRGGPRLAVPIPPPEVWAAGVTYRDSLRERQAESGSPDAYAQVYGLSVRSCSSRRLRRG